MESTNAINIFAIDPGLFVWSLITFLILLGLLYWKAFKPLMRIQQARQDEIHQAIHDAERLRDEAQELLTGYKRQLADARQEAESILDRARSLGETNKAEILEEARVQAEATLAKARKQIERDTAQALDQIREEVAGLTMAATERVARISMSEKDQLRLIQEAINEIDLSKVSEN
jgi:F-type H+-transporting ATPase subunit b